MKPPSLTLGIEEEYQIIDPETRELRSYITEILNGDQMLLGEIKPELHQSMVEIGTRVCRTPAEVRAELVRLRGHVMQLAARNGLVDRGGGYPSILLLDDPGDHPVGAVHGRAAGSGGPGPAAADLRHPRPHRDRRSGLPDRRHERGPLLRAPRADPVHQLALLDGARHRPEILPERHLPQLPPNRDPAGAGVGDRLRRPGGHPGRAPAAFPTAPRSGGTSGPTTATPRSSSACATSAPGSTRRCAWPRSCRPS